MGGGGGGGGIVLLGHRTGQLALVTKCLSGSSGSPVLGRGGGEGEGEVLYFWATIPSISLWLQDVRQGVVVDPS